MVCSLLTAKWEIAVAMSATPGFASGEAVRPEDLDWVIFAAIMAAPLIGMIAATLVAMLLEP